VSDKLFALLSVALAGALACESRKTVLTPEQLAAFRRRCEKAPLLELGDILFNTRSKEEAEIVTAEINKRLPALKSSLGGK
jgi:hypothetical protein